MATSDAIDSPQWNGNVQQGAGNHIHRCIHITGCTAVLGCRLEQDPYVVERKKRDYRRCHLQASHAQDW